MTRRRPRKAPRRPRILPDLSEEQWATFGALMTTHALLVPAMQKRLQALAGLLWSEYMVLAALGRARAVAALAGIEDPGLRPVDLAQLSGLSKQAARNAVNRLYVAPGEGYLEEWNNPAHEGSVLLTLTDEGVELLRICDLEMAQFARAVLVDVVTGEDLAALRRALTAVCAQFGVEVDVRLPAPRRAGQAPALPFKGETPTEEESDE